MAIDIQEKVIEALFSVADKVIRESLEELRCETECTANELLARYGKRCHIELTLEYDDLPESRWRTRGKNMVEITTSEDLVRVYTESPFSKEKKS